MPKLIKFFLQKCGAYSRAALKTIVIPLCNVFTRISAAARINPKCGAYLSQYCNLQLKSLLHLGQKVIAFRQPRPQGFSLKKWVGKPWGRGWHLGSLLHLGPLQQLEQHRTFLSQPGSGWLQPRHQGAFPWPWRWPSPAPPPKPGKSALGTRLGWLIRGTLRQFSENICLEDDFRSRIFGTFVVKFLACLPLLRFSNS